MGFFDGVALGGLCGVGMVIKIDNHIMIKDRLKARIGSNTRAEVIGPWILLTCAKFWGLNYLQVLGDSKVIISWVLGRAHVKSLELNHWLVSTKYVMNDFLGLSFNHVYRELNADADLLSKITLGEMDGKLHYSLFLDDSVVREGHIALF